MQRWMRILGTAVMAAALAVGTAAADDPLEDFLVLGADPDDFRPGSEAASAGSLFFVGGSTSLTDVFGDAAIVALDERDGSEVWRASEGEADVPESFSVVGVAGGRVCAAGAIINQAPRRFVQKLEVLVACYRAERGERLWVRRIGIEAVPTFEFNVGPSAPGLHVSKRAVIVTLSTLSSRVFGARDLVLRFDARDGTGR